MPTVGQMAPDKRVLLVEDEPSVATVVARSLETAGFESTIEIDGARALDIASNDSFDIVILDLTLPSLDGVEVCRRLREVSTVPILIVTGRSETSQVVEGLEAGADDYLCKPFKMEELVARVGSLLRRASGAYKDPVLALGDIMIDSRAQRVTKNGNEVRLTATEFRLLIELARRTGRVMTRETLLQMVWGYDYLGASRLVDMAITRLRSKLEEDPSNPKLITTVRGAGYRLDEPPDPAAVAEGSRADGPR